MSIYGGADSWVKALGWAALIIVGVLFILWVLYPEYVEEGWNVIIADDGYTCPIGVSVPLVQITDDGNVACLSEDGINCIPKECHLAMIEHRNDPVKWSKPVVCGEALKEHWGGTGYDYVAPDGRPDGHWCQRGMKSYKAGGFSLWSRIKNAVAARKLREDEAAKAKV